MELEVYPKDFKFYDKDTSLDELSNIVKDSLDRMVVEIVTPYPNKDLRVLHLSNLFVKYFCDSHVKICLSQTEKLQVERAEYYGKNMIKIGGIDIDSNIFWRHSYDQGTNEYELFDIIMKDAKL